MADKKRKTLHAEETPRMSREKADEVMVEVDGKRSAKKARKSLVTEQISTPSAGSLRRNAETPRTTPRAQSSEREKDDSGPTPLLSERAKGKRKAVASSEEEEERDENEDEEDSGDEVEFNFKVLGISSEATMGTPEPGRSNKLITSFETQPYTYHGDYMAPFRGIIAEWKNDPQIAGAEISDLFREDTRLKLMAATTGREFTSESKRAIVFVIEVLTGRKPTEVQPIRKSAWAVVTMNDRAGVKKLLEQKVVCDPLKRLLISFRKPANTPTRERVFEVRNVNEESDLESLRTLLAKERAKVLEESPPPGEWTTVFSGRIVWKVKAPDTEWQVTSRAVASKGNYLYLMNSPTCDTCHSDDHHFSSCPWTNILPDIKFRRNTRR